MLDSLVASPPPQPPPCSLQLPNKLVDLHVLPPNGRPAMQLGGCVESLHQLVHCDRFPRVPLGVGEVMQLDVSLPPVDQRRDLRLLPFQLPLQHLFLLPDLFPFLYESLQSLRLLKEVGVSADFFHETPFRVLVPVADTTGFPRTPLCGPRHQLLQARDAVWICPTLCYSLVNGRSQAQSGRPIMADGRKKAQEDEDAGGEENPLPSIRGASSQQL
mmetsp:Transcript_24897/g.56202  ORF Transcript_24897/g.56202 Transcript_24897/m.56202 type:complete len:216 (+) Transcript_24897:361-1008(+)